MNRAKWVLLLLSLLIAIAGTWFYIAAKRTATPIPIYALGMIAYGWIFVGYLALDAAARTYKNRYRGK